MKRPRLSLLVLAVALAAAATVIAVSGGFRTTVGGFRVSMRGPLAAAVGALLATAWWLYLARRDRSIAADLEAAWFAIERNASRLVGVVALVAAIVAAAFATRSAAGADASGYLSHAAAWSAPSLPSHVESLVVEFRELDGWPTTPLGWRPGTNRCDGCVGLQVPTYPPGLPLLMALPHAVAGTAGATAVVTASAALAVWATGLLAGGGAGVIAATLLAFLPVFVYQSIQPMSDVPVTAAWMLSFLVLVRGKREWLAGVACAVAVLIRPNLAPLAIVPLSMAERKVPFAMPVAIAGLFLGLLNAWWYGSPYASGYGPASELFAIANVGPNARQYFIWFIGTAPLFAFAPIGYFLTRERRSHGLAAFALLVVAAYLIYAVFDHWSYLRFLLPALAVFAVFAAVAFHAWIERTPAAWRAGLLVALLLMIVATGLTTARSLDTFKLADQLRRVEQVAAHINQQVPADAVIISGEQSGSMRYYTARPILRWEAATTDTLSNAISGLEQSNRPVYVVLDAWENEPFLARFSSLSEVQLDWPPVLEAGTSHRTRLWRLADRARFQAGENLQTVRVP